MEDASPTKWHLAHTSWFFETFLLKPHLSGYSEFHPKYNFLFNSYYEAVGPRHPRPRRGMLTRPPLADILRYRSHVNDGMARFFNDARLVETHLPTIELGIHHEKQHQELIVTDIKHALSLNPLEPAAYESGNNSTGETRPFEWFNFDGGIVSVGHAGNAFAFDNEGPAHEQLLRPFRLANRAVTNGEFIEFIEDGGYSEPRFWLSDGWARLREEQWNAPLYWYLEDDVWFSFTLQGTQQINPAAPVTHVSFYEAAAYAEWKGARLPLEFEWETAARQVPVGGHFLDSGCLAPQPAEDDGLMQMYGDVWEWTASPYVAYPGFRAPDGAVGEYNGKFMSGQMVLRGGSCATPADHIRPTYRNFFPPHARWQFSGIRLAADA